MVETGKGTAGFCNEAAVCFPKELPAFCWKKHAERLLRPTTGTHFPLKYPLFNSQLTQLSCSRPETWGRGQEEPWCCPSGVVSELPLS